MLWYVFHLLMVRKRLLVEYRYIALLGAPQLYVVSDALHHVVPHIVLCGQVEALEVGSTVL